MSVPNFFVCQLVFYSPCVEGWGRAWVRALGDAVSPGSDPESRNCGHLSLSLGSDEWRDAIPPAFACRLTSPRGYCGVGIQQLHLYFYDCSTTAGYDDGIDFWVTTFRHLQRLPAASFSFLFYTKSTSQRTQQCQQKPMERRTMANTRAMICITQPRPAEGEPVHPYTQ